MVRNRHQFDFQKFRDIPDSHFTMAQNIDDPQPNRLGEGLQLIRAGSGLKVVVFQRESTLSTDVNDWGFTTRLV